MVEEYNQKIVLDESSKRVFANVFSPKVSGDVAVIPENIKKDVELLGITGTYDGGDTPTPTTYPLYFEIINGYMGEGTPTEIEDGAEIVVTIKANDGYIFPESVSVMPPTAYVDYDKYKGELTLRGTIIGPSGSDHIRVSVYASCQLQPSPSALIAFKEGDMPDGVDVDPEGLDSATLNSFIENIQESGYLVTFGDPQSSGYGNSGIAVAELDADAAGDTKVKIINIDVYSADSTYPDKIIYSPQAFTAYADGQEIGNILQGWQAVYPSDYSLPLSTRNNFRISERYIGDVSEDFAPLNGTCLGEYFK